MTVIRRLFKIHDSRLHDELNNYLLISSYIISTNTIDYRLFDKYYLDYCRNAFGMSSSRFQIFKKLIPFSPDKVDLFVMTC